MKKSQVVNKITESDNDRTIYFAKSASIIFTFDFCFVNADILYCINQLLMPMSRNETKPTAFRFEPVVATTKLAELSLLRAVFHSFINFPARWERNKNVYVKIS